MVKRPFEDMRPIGPFIEGDFRNQFDWAVDDDIAHHIYNKTIDSDYVGFGSFTILTEAFMNFFPDRGRQSGLNNWFFTRDGRGDYELHEWLKVPNRMDIESPESKGEEITNDILFDTSTTPNPEATKVTSQQYTTNGALFTYELRQDWQAPATAFVRVPVPQELSDESKKIADGTKFEYFEFQSREYRSQFAQDEVPEDRSTFFHPHFKARNIKSAFELEVFFNNAFDIMEKGVKLENR